jgi:peroxidase
VYSIRKSVTGNDLPSPRKLFTDVLLKAKKYPRPADDPNDALLFMVLMLTHDMGHQVPTEAFDNCKEIRCCATGNKAELFPPFQSSVCLPIRIPDDDAFYKQSEVKCLNLVRSEIASTPGSTQYGEILNKVTSFLDLSTIYSSEYLEMRKSRILKDGKMYLGPKNLLPSDQNGKYTSTSSRFISVIMGAVWPILFARNHNSLCDGLKLVNPLWNDEKLFQEARRINIALLQRLILGGTIIEAAFRKRINGNYSANNDPSASIEFTTSAYRFLHYYMNTNMKMITKDNQATFTPVSDLFGRIDILEDRFDDVLRGQLGQKANFGQYSEECQS